LRPLHLPRAIIPLFLDLAAHNTARSIETCAVLAGVLRQNAFFVTTLMVPKQHGTSDTCTTEDEEGLFAALEERGVIAMGWVHTHPTQTCFLSSVDLHTHCSYQLMLPEAIAIVLSPRHTPSCGVFRLSDPTGVDLISSCDRGPGFHPHDEPEPPLPPIYVDADGGSVARGAGGGGRAGRGGHVVWMGGEDDEDIGVVDFR
ncbi:hypothetical protein DFJ73DRAFT_625413, partial [Zopfochytrium polystomum]